ncbi:MAG TPA: hypothetical protein DEO85_11935 [Maritimibacter sp.]|nr:hypothetical protein [Maritimibacter sp.]
MPTFARLVAAVLLAVLGFGVSFLTFPYFDEGVPVSGIPVVAAIMGVIVGWTFTGARFQRQSGNAVAIGITSVVVQTLLTLFAFAIKRMVDRAFRNAYDTVMESIVGVFDVALEYIQIIAQPDVVLAALVGGAIVGAITNWVAVRTR